MIESCAPNLSKLNRLSLLLRIDKKTIILRLSKYNNSIILPNMTNHKSFRFIDTIKL